MKKNMLKISSIFGIAIVFGSSCQSRRDNQYDTLAAGSPGKSKAGVFRFTDCDAPDGPDSKKNLILNIVTNAKGQAVAVEGMASFQQTAGDFVHGFSTITGKISDLSFDHDTLFITLANGKESINADGDIQDGGKVTRILVGIGRDSTTKVEKTKGETFYKGCTTSNEKIFSNIFE